MRWGPGGRERVGGARDHWSPPMRMRQRAKLSTTIPQTPSISLTGVSGRTSGQQNPDEGEHHANDDLDFALRHAAPRARTAGTSP
jgi:hypothetical protein